MKKTVSIKRIAKPKVGTASASAEPASSLIDQRIMELGDWRGKMLAKVRKIIHDADPEIVEEWKWMGTPVFSHSGIVCTAETYKSVVKLTFHKGASLPDPAGLFNSSLDGNVRRAIDIHEGESIDAAAFKVLVRAAAAANTAGKAKTPGTKPAGKKVAAKKVTAKKAAGKAARTGTTT